MHRNSEARVLWDITSDNALTDWLIYRKRGVCRYWPFSCSSRLTLPERLHGIYETRDFACDGRARTWSRDLTFADRASYYISIMKQTWCTFHSVKLQSWHTQLTLYTRNIPNDVCVAPPEDEQIMLETCRGPWFSINWMKSATRWFHYTDEPGIFIRTNKIRKTKFVKFSMPVIAYITNRMVR
jgi:hypothetical protein